MEKSRDLNNCLKIVPGFKHLFNSSLIQRSLEKDFSPSLRFLTASPKPKSKVVQMPFMMNLLFEPSIWYILSFLVGK